MSAILLAIFIALQLADIWTTYQVLARGGRELNPLLAGVMRHLGVLPALIIFKALLIALVLRYLNGFPIILAALCIAYAVVVARNWQQLKRAKSS